MTRYFNELYIIRIDLKHYLKRFFFFYNLLRLIYDSSENRIYVMFFVVVTLNMW